MIKKEEVYKIGRIGKAHGVKGEVTFNFDDDVFDRVDAVDLGQHKRHPEFPVVIRESCYTSYLR